MRIIGHMVTRNELGRWLTSTLPWLMEICSGNVSVYDDQSSDDTVDYVRSLGAHVARRQDAISSFANNEGIFRWAGWQSMERALAPRIGDWILAIDADELLLANTPGGDLSSVVAYLADSIHRAEIDGQRTVTFKVAEVFALDGMGWPLVRTDGYWGSISACRLAKWQVQGIFESRKEGGGSLPSAWPKSIDQDPHLELMHLGYARPEDRTIKYRRYQQGAGHNPRHVASILQPPTLEHWSGMRAPLGHDTES